MRQWISVDVSQAVAASGSVALVAASQPLKLVPGSRRVVFASADFIDGSAKFNMGARCVPRFQVTFLDALGGSLGTIVLKSMSEGNAAWFNGVATAISDVFGTTYCWSYDGAVDPFFVQGRGGYPPGATDMLLEAQASVTNSDAGLPHTIVLRLRAVMTEGERQAVEPPLPWRPRKKSGAPRPRRPPRPQPQPGP